MKRPRRLFRDRHREPDPGANVFLTAPWDPAKRPVLLTEPRLEDLAPYGPEMLRAIEEGYRLGLVEPCVLVVWRGGRCAREHGLDRADSPLIFRPIAGPDLCELAGRPRDLTRDAVEELPIYNIGLALAETVQVHMGTDMTPEGMILAWRHSRHFRREMGPKIGEEGVRELERRTGIAREA
jgi:hypothetical protein